MKSQNDNRIVNQMVSRRTGKIVQGNAERQDLVGDLRNEVP